MTSAPRVWFLVTVQSLATVFALTGASGCTSEIGDAAAAASDARPGGSTDGQAAGQPDGSLPDPTADGGADGGADAAPGSPDAPLATEDPRLAACRAITPVADPAQNWLTIQSCLNEVGLARLGAGVYPISAPLAVPPSALLEGVGAPRPRLVLQAGIAGNSMLGFTASSPPDAKARVRHLALDAHDALGLYANAAIVHFTVDNSVVEDCELYNETMPPAGHVMAGAYFICDACTGNELRASDLHTSFYGVIFRGASAAVAENLVADSEIHGLKCDPISFAGYGVAERNRIHDNGYDCENGPIPGGGIYTLLNAAGGVIRGNTIWNTCGHGLDLDRARGLVIEDNVMTSPGYQFGGFAPWCGWASGALFLGLRDSVIRRNVAVADGARNRVVAGGYDVYAARGTPAFSDLPAGGDTVVGAIFAEPREPAGWESGNNTIEDNQFRGTCAAGEACTGLGLFTSRGTGYDGTAWSAATTNYFTGNSTVGSNVGSTRCGGNWFAGASICVAGSPPPCNDDDYQHDGTFHGDACSFF